jgi:K+-transporting ATPase ATPase C chain
MKTELRPALTLLATLTLVCGVFYPILVTGIGMATFLQQAAGSLIIDGNVLKGSSLIGQSFSSPKYFWGRPSATSPMPNNAAGSSGSNLGPTNPAQIEAVKSRIATLLAADPDNQALVPVDLVTASASGLDPDISVAAANYQLARVARVRGMPVDQVSGLVAKATLAQQAGFFGEPRVNVLALNRALDQLAAGAQPAGTR